MDNYVVLDRSIIPILFSSTYILFCSISFHSKNLSFLLNFSWSFSNPLQIICQFGSTITNFAPHDLEAGAWESVTKFTHEKISKIKLGF